MAGDNVQMFILCSLTQGEAHGYQLLARAKKWGVEDWAGFSAGSVYNAFRTLEKRGLIVRCGTEQHGGYAPATLYSITDAGRARAVEMIHEAVEHAAVHDPFDLATAFFGLLPVEERKQLVERRVALVEERVDHWDAHHAHMEEHVAAGQPYDWVLAAMEKGLAMGDAALASARELLTRCEEWGPPERLGRTGGPLEDAVEAKDESAAGR